MSFVNFPPKEVKGGFALFELGFRPFFLAAGISGALLMAAWLHILGSGQVLVHYYPINAWHGHEMLLGFTFAVVIGFLLTAARNWTQVQTIRRTPLAILLVIWLIGRITPFLPLSDLTIALSDIIFLPLATIFILHPIVKAKQFNNMVFLPIMLVMIAGNILFHMSLFGAVSLPYIAGLDLIRWTVLILLILMGGRVIPFFIERGFAGAKPTRSYKVVELLLVPATVLAALMTFLPSAAVVAGIVLMIAAVLHWVRLLGWYQHGVWGTPILWVLIVGYAWIPLGLSLLAFAQFGFFHESTAFHAIMAGSVGTLTLGMMARVTRGHTGRDIQANKITVISFYLVIAAGLVRVFGASFPMMSWMLSGTLWILAFGIFSYSHFMYLWRPRVDGRPG